jgi:hypothetical protein
MGNSSFGRGTLRLNMTGNGLTAAGYATLLSNTAGETLTAIAGVYVTPVTESAVYVTSTGQLGVQASSERYKTDIATMPEVSMKLSRRSRPVTFHYKWDAKSVQHYGLIAEEVENVHPELVRMTRVRYREFIKKNWRRCF